jgi:hypothetical protein
MTTEELNFDPSMRTCMQAIEGLRSINEKADRANLTNYQIQLENGYMDVYLY